MKRLKKKAMEAQMGLYPVEYGQPTDAKKSGQKTAASSASHSLIPEALQHAFSTFGVLMSPDLPF